MVEWAQRFSKRAWGARVLAGTALRLILLYRSAYPGSSALRCYEKQFNIFPLSDLDTLHDSY